MVSLFKNNFKLFFKNKYFFISYILTLITCNVYLIWELQWINNSHIIRYLRMSQRLSIICFVYFIFISYEYMMSSENVSLKETIATVYKGKIKLFLNQYIILLIPIIFISINILVYNVFLYYKLSIQSTPYLIHIFKNIILNITLISIIGSLAGSVIALRLKRFSAYAIMALIVFGVSPIFENIAFSLYRLTSKNISPINIYPYWDVIRILAPDLDWATDRVYGLAIETIRWNLTAFWICMLSAICLFKVGWKKVKSVRVVTLILAMLAIINFVVFFQQGSIIRKDYRPDGALFADEFYEEKIRSVTKEANFDVIAYDMTLDIKRRMKADVKLTIETFSDIESYSFTLYRGYKILTITDAEGNMLDYRREGNYFDILHHFDEGITDIYIKYSGSGNKYYSNNQGIALPGYFAYYPMPGYLKFWDEDTGDAYVNTDFIPKEFTIKINSHLNIVSNLKKSNDNVYTGTALTATFIGGFIYEENIDGITVTNYPSGKVDNSWVANITKRWNDISELIGEEREVTFKDKKIIIGPETIYATSGSMSEIFVDLDDHIITMYSDLTLFFRSYIASLIPYSDNKKLLKEKFLFYISNNEYFLKEHQNIMPSLELLMKGKNIDLEESEEAFIFYMESQIAFGNLLRVKIDELGEGYVLKEVYKYLLDEEDDTHEIDFLYKLK